jgi:hypothetical protein
MEGTGKEVNYEQIRDELQSTRSMNPSDTEQSQMVSDTPNSTYMEAFNTFLKVFCVINKNQNDPDISFIQQSAFFQPRNSQLKGSSSQRGSLRSIAQQNKPKNLALSEKLEYRSIVYNIDNQKGNRHIKNQLG